MTPEELSRLDEQNKKLMNLMLLQQTFPKIARMKKAKMAFETAVTIILLLGFVLITIFFS